MIESRSTANRDDSGSPGACVSRQKMVGIGAGMGWPRPLLLGLCALPVAEGAVAILGSPVVDFVLVAVCIAAIVAFTILFEIGLESLEHKLKSFPLYEEML